MKARGAAVQGALAVAGLAAAYFTWQRPPTPDASEVVVLDATKNALEKVRYDDGTRWVELSRTREQGEPVVWLTQGGRPAPAAPVSDGGVDGGALAASLPPPPAPLPTEPRVFRGGERADKAYDRFAPLRATRALGTLSEEKVKELGLQDSKRRLEVSASGVQRRFVVASATTGLAAPYLQDEQDKKVYLVSSALFTELDPTSQQLFERRLHAFKAGDFDAFTVAAEGKSKAYVVTGAETPAQTRVAPKASPDKPDEVAKLWHDKVMSRLMVTEVLPRGEKPKAGEPTVALRVDYAARGKPKGWLELGNDPAGGLWARTELTANWVGVHTTAEDVVKEAKKLVE